MGELLTLFKKFGVTAVILAYFMVVDFNSRMDNREITSKQIESIERSIIAFEELTGKVHDNSAGIKVNGANIVNLDKRVDRIEDGR